MISKIKYSIILALLALISCKKDRIPSDIIFTESCELSDRAKILSNIHGTLYFDDSLPGLPLPEPIFFIDAPSEILPITICNMPPEFTMAEGELKEVTFSGRIEVYPENVDAISVPMELHRLKLE